MNYLSVFTTGGQLGHAIAALILVSLIILSGVVQWLMVRDKPDDTDWDGDIAPYPFARRHDEDRAA